MVQRGHQVTVLTTDVASRRSRLKVLREQLGGADIVRVRNLSQRLVGANLYTPLGFARTLGRLLPAHDLVHVHDVFNWLTVQTARALGRGVLERFDLIHAVRPEEFDPEALGVPKDKLRYIANGTPFPAAVGEGTRFRQRFDLGDRMIVLFVGQLQTMKGIDLMLQLAGERRGDRELCFVFTK